MWSDIWWVQGRGSPPGWPPSSAGGLTGPPAPALQIVDCVMPIIRVADPGGVDPDPTFE